jgi:hypothetical protein
MSLDQSEALEFGKEELSGFGCQVVGDQKECGCDRDFKIVRPRGCRIAHAYDRLGAKPTWIVATKGLVIKDHQDSLQPNPRNIHAVEMRKKLNGRSKRWLSVRGRS